MEGPTPVSALIHAATMVTAGVFMVARLSPLFEQAPAAMSFVTIIGGTTCFFAATIGCVQTDIKRVVAYSTCSQLGYMFVGLGVGGFGLGIFHLFTHAFFKALLFLVLRLGDHRDAPRAGHAPHGRAAHPHPAHLLGDDDRGRWRSSASRSRRAGTRRTRSSRPPTPRRHRATSTLGCWRRRRWVLTSFYSFRLRLYDLLPAATLGGRRTRMPTTPASRTRTAPRRISSRPTAPRRAATTTSPPTIRTRRLHMT